MSTATINVRLNEELKKSAYSALDELDISPSEAVRLLFEYISINKRLPIQTMVVSDEDIELITSIKNRLANPQQSIRVNLDDL